MVIGKQTIGVVLVTLLFSGCMTVMTIPDDMGRTSGNVTMDAMAPEISAVAENESEGMIVVTITQEFHQSLTAGQRIRPTPSKGVKASTQILPIGYKNFLDELSARFGLVRIADWPLQSIGARCLVFQSTGLSPRDEIVASLTQDSRIVEAQPLNLFKTLADAYDDPYLELQHGFRTMQVERSHQWATGENIAVAIIDTGVDVTHNDLSDRVVLARNFVDQDSVTFQSDLHGTAVAAVIGATANNAVGIVGVAPRARLLALKGCWQPVPGVNEAVCSSFTLAKSIDFAVLQNVDVINLSLAGPPDPLLEMLVKGAIEKGISVVGALDANEPGNFPAYIEGVVAVSRNDTATADVSAPGNKIISAKPKGEYDFFSGNSISAAHVSGLIALIRERRPHFTYADILPLLQSTSSITRGAADIHPVNACRAVSAAIGTGQCESE